MACVCTRQQRCARRSAGPRACSLQASAASLALVTAASSALPSSTCTAKHARLAGLPRARFRTNWQASDTAMLASRNSTPTLPEARACACGKQHAGMQKPWHWAQWPSACVPASPSRALHVSHI